jgi:hypothetical protein
LFHVNRSLYIAESLINNVLPKKEKIQEISLNLKDRDWCLNKEIELRNKASDMYQNQLLHNYYIPETDDSLLNIILQANNTREFKY